MENNSENKNEYLGKKRSIFDEVENLKNKNINEPKNSPNKNESAFTEVKKDSSTNIKIKIDTTPSKDENTDENKEDKSLKQNPVDLLERLLKNTNEGNNNNNNNELKQNSIENNILLTNNNQTEAKDQPTVNIPTPHFESTPPKNMEKILISQESASSMVPQNELKPNMTISNAPENKLPLMNNNNIPIFPPQNNAPIIEETLFNNNLPQKESSYEEKLKIGSTTLKDLVDLKLQIQTMQMCVDIQKNSISELVTLVDIFYKEVCYHKQINDLQRHSYIVFQNQRNQNFMNQQGMNFNGDIHALLEMQNISQTYQNLSNLQNLQGLQGNMMQLQINNNLNLNGSTREQSAQDDLISGQIPGHANGEQNSEQIIVGNNSGDNINNNSTTLVNNSNININNNISNNNINVSLQNINNDISRPINNIEIPITTNNDISRPTDPILNNKNNSTPNLNINLSINLKANAPQPSTLPPQGQLTHVQRSDKPQENAENPEKKLEGGENKENSFKEKFKIIKDDKTQNI